MSADLIAAEEAFRRVGARELECLHSPAPTKPVEWVNFEYPQMLNNELGRLESKFWWRGWEDTTAFLWHVNEMRVEAGLPPLAIRVYPMGAGHYFVEEPA